MCVNIKRGRYLNSKLWIFGKESPDVSNYPNSWQRCISNYNKLRLTPHTHFKVGQVKSSLQGHRQGRCEFGSSLRGFAKRIWTPCKFLPKKLPGRIKTSLNCPTLFLGKPGPDLGMFLPSHSHLHPMTALKIDCSDHSLSLRCQTKVQRFTWGLSPGQRAPCFKRDLPALVYIPTPQTH